MNAEVYLRASKWLALVCFLMLVVMMMTFSLYCTYQMGRINQRNADQMAQWDRIEKQTRELKARLDLEMLKFKEPK